jgi:predicted dehydrogenase
LILFIFRRYEAYMGKYHFIIIGSGWRSLYYVRIAKAMPDILRLDAMYCRIQEKADKMAEEFSIHTTTSIEECVGYKPDFAVVAVNKTSICDVSIEWMDRGITVLSETPAALDMDSLKKLYRYHMSDDKTDKKQVVAEQYREYPYNKARINLVNSGVLGDISCLNISIAHEYHGFSLIRAYLGIKPDENYTVSGKIYEFPTTQTLTRYDKFTDGRTAPKKRCVAVFEFESGKVAWYDFDSEQYRSPIRKNMIKVQGVRGELINNELYYLDENNVGRKETIVTDINKVMTGNGNPNLAQVNEIKKIAFGDKILYEPVWGLRGLSEDETAIATLMCKTAEYSRGQALPPYSLENALADAYAAILLDEAVRTSNKVSSCIEKICIAKNK